MDSPIQQTTERCSEGLGYGKLYECKPIPKICANEVLHAIDTGQNQAVVAKTFSVSIATIKRYLKRRREVEHVFPKAIPGLR